MRIEDAPRILNAAINKAVNKNTGYTLKILERRVLSIQGKFFTYLVNSSGIIGGSSTPALPTDGTYRPLNQPKWPSFSKSYLAEKKSNYKTKSKKAASSYTNRFFINTGELKNSLKGLSATSLFGTPKVVFTPTDKRQELLQNFSGNRRLGVISVDFFPKLVNLKAQFNSNFYRTFFNQKQTQEAGKKPVFIGMKLDNKDSKRPFIGQYMQWWVKVKAKQAVLKGVV